MNAVLRKQDAPYLAMRKQHFANNPASCLAVQVAGASIQRTPSMPDCMTCSSTPGRGRLRLLLLLSSRWGLLDLQLGHAVDGLCTTHGGTRTAQTSITLPRCGGRLGADLALLRDPLRNLPLRNGAPCIPARGHMYDRIRVCCLATRQQRRLGDADGSMWHGRRSLVSGCAMQR